MRNKDKTLWVKATPQAQTREIDTESGKILFMPGAELRLVGKDSNGNVLPQGQRVPYHSHYIKEIKEHSLLPMDLETAQLAGVQWNPDTLFS